jgi:hypothetical protein
MMDPWDDALAAYLRQQGANNPRILDKRPSHVAHEMRYTVEADAWAMPSQVGAGTVREITVWRDGQGTAIMGEVSRTP